MSVILKCTHVNNDPYNLFHASRIPLNAIQEISFLFYCFHWYFKLSHNAKLIADFSYVFD